MKTQNGQKSAKKAAHALVMVLVMTSVGIGMYAGLASLTSSSTRINDRNNTYNSAVAAAEAASEQALSYMSRDFLNQSFDPDNLGRYRGLIPSQDWAAGYQFSDGFGTSNQTWVSSSSTMVMTNLNSQFLGLYGLAYSCTVRAAAKPLGVPYDMTAAVQQDVQLAAIPVFQFAIFYSMDLEVNPGPVMKVTGKVHSNANIYTAPVSGLEYGDDVTAVGHIYNNRMPDDPTGGSKVIPVYDNQKVENSSSLTLPIGTNNNPVAVREILEVPPFSENPRSPTGEERLYNKVDLVVTTTATNLTVKAGYWDGFVDVTPDIPGSSNTPAQYSFIKTNTTFFDQRENKYTLMTDIDVGAFSRWMTNAGASLNNYAQFQVGHQLNSLFVNDQRSAANKLTAVRVYNGRQLPPAGLTVATPLPLYVQGHYNAPNTTPGSTDTSHTKPAALLADAITVLSANWEDANSARALSQRAPSDTTVNAAFLAGIVQTTNAAGIKHYSGGVENFPRFLEDWSGRNFTYNGSMVVMFPSKYASSFWVNTGVYYNAPNRKWAFDVNFLDYRKLPPATPVVRKLVRGQWNVIAAR
jgi:hypothetical protein